MLSVKWSREESHQRTPWSVGKRKKEKDDVSGFVLQMEKKNKKATGGREKEEEKRVRTDEALISCLTRKLKNKNDFPHSMKEEDSCIYNHEFVTIGYI